MAKRITDATGRNDYVFILKDKYGGILAFISEKSALDYATKGDGFGLTRIKSTCGCVTNYDFSIQRLKIRR